MNEHAKTRTTPCYCANNTTSVANQPNHACFNFVAMYFIHFPLHITIIRIDAHYLSHASWVSRVHTTRQCGSLLSFVHLTHSIDLTKLLKCY